MDTRDPIGSPFLQFKHDPLEAPTSHSMNIGNPGGPLPEYMAPEDLRSDQARADRRSNGGINEDGTCKEPPCAICFPDASDSVNALDRGEAELFKPPLVSSLMDDAGLARIREFNADYGVQAPTADDVPREPEFAPARAAMEEAACELSPFIGKVKVAEPDIKYIPPQSEEQVVPDLYSKDVRPQPEGSDTMTLDFSGEIDGGGVKDSMKDKENKPMMALVPHALIWGCAKVLTYGAKKYAPNNWRRGMRWGECADALLRHIFAWLEGEDVDPESGLSHLSHCAANLAFLMHMETNPDYALMDDRPQTRRYTEDG